MIATAKGEGFMAAAEGREPDACPYPEGHSCRGEWLMGWVLARTCGAFVVKVRGPTDEDRAEFEAMCREAKDA